VNHELTGIELINAQLKQDFAVSLPTRLKPNPGQRDVHFGLLRFSESTLAIGKSSVGPLNGTIKFNNDGTFKDITVSDKSGHAELNIKPLNDKFSIDFSARNWTPPGPYEIRVDQLVVRGLADHDGVVADDVNGLLFGAAVVGQAQLNWQDGWKLNGTLETKGMDAESLIALVSDTTRATGRLAGTANFAFAGSDYDSIFQQAQLSMKFTISDGQLHNMDLVAPLRSQGATAVRRGGQTQFNTFSGTIANSEKGVSITGISLNGGKFSAVGAINFDPKHQATGHLNTRLSSGAIAVEAPVIISGTLDSPEIRSEGANKPGGVDGTTQIF
jgi:hypothetical protein